MRMRMIVSRFPPAPSSLVAQAPSPATSLLPPLSPPPVPPGGVTEFRIWGSPLVALVTVVVLVLLLHFQMIILSKEGVKVWRGGGASRDFFFLLALIKLVSWLHEHIFERHSVRGCGCGCAAIPLHLLLITANLISSHLVHCFCLLSFNTEQEEEM